MHARRTPIFVLAALGLAGWAMINQGCATSGVGTGRLVAGGQASPGAVSFEWHASADATRGTIAVVLPDGRDFFGNFMQVTSTTVSQDLNPYWSAWGTPWYGWHGTGAYNDGAFVRHYSGHVIAQLRGPEGQRMRCSFQLARPEDGPRSGGQGECELSNGDRIDYAELRGR